MYKCLAERPKHLYMKHTIQIPLRGKTVQLFSGAPDRHAAFTTSLCLDANFAMTPRALRTRHPAAPDAPPVLRSKPANLPAPGFKVQTGKPASSDVDACPTSRQAQRRLQDLSRSRRTGSLLELAITFLLDLDDAVFITFMYSYYSVHHVDRP